MFSGASLGKNGKYTLSRDCSTSLMREESVENSIWLVGSIEKKWLEKVGEKVNCEHMRLYLKVGQKKSKAH